MQWFIVSVFLAVLLSVSAKQCIVSEFPRTGSCAVIRRDYVTMPDGARIHYRLQGSMDPSKPTIVFVHGGSVSHAIWTCQQEYLCADGYQTLAIDNRGNGNSSRSDDYPYTFAAHAADLVAVINALPISRPPVAVGTSIGGAIVLQAHVRYPNTFSKLVLSNAGPQYIADSVYTSGITQARLDQILAQQRSNFTAYIETTRRSNLDDGVVSERVVQWLIALGLANGFNATYKVFQDFPNHNVTALLGGITIPVGLFWGDKDRTFPSSVMRFLHERLPNSWPYVFRGKSNDPYMTAWRDFNTQLVRFVSGSISRPDSCEAMVDAYADD